MIAKLDPEQRKMFGEGPTESLPQESKELGNRFEVLQQMQNIAAGLRRMGRYVPDAEDLFRRAYAATFPDAVFAHAAREIEEKLEKRSELVTEEPGGPTPASSTRVKLPGEDGVEISRETDAALDAVISRL
ncbi:MAG: hypothetical protein DRP01_04945 [Archaeoglobales archaeon]|nr:MAG: hypothetical protein DRP01_04945 [Archaeoglobales archaeon]